MTKIDRHSNRRILFLQGPPSGFWRQLARQFRFQGAETFRVALCAGDLLYWPSLGTKLYLGKLRDWSEWLRSFLVRHQITDIVYYGDRQPYHRAAADVARSLNISAFAVEFGYLRPGWLTLERGGMGLYSHFPNDPETISSAAADLDSSANDGGAYAHHWVHEMFHEIVFNVTVWLYSPIFRNYDPDRYYDTFTEYFSGAWRLLKKRKLARNHAAVETLCRSRKWPYVIYPLQLQSDWQIRANSPFRDQRQALKQVIGSFAEQAPSDMRLLVKLHPLDPGIIDWSAEASRIARDFGLADRVLFLDGGDLKVLIEHSSGVILINSTVGLQALQLGCPVKTLGIAVYDVPRLTHQGPLDAFWTDPEPVDAALCRDFVKLLAAAIQVPGSFYNRGGRDAAAAEIVDRVLNNRVNEPNAFVTPPPRLPKAIELGVVVD
ncbi:MAG: capsular biosynthesis protein [Devosiaceae bacterium]|nr:capsular biosynthesis protein [Devosiaceae bacterium MH13]